MRIGQLARRLGIPPSDIIGFLTAKGVQVESGANSRLTDDAVSAIIGQFAPGTVLEPVAEPVAQPLEIVTEEVAEEQVVVVSEAPAPTEDIQPTVTPEVIRVSKVELQGLKVIGKIDLPQPKKKTEDEPKSEQEQKPDLVPERGPQPATQRPPRKEFPRRNERRESREWKNPLQQKRHRDAQEAESKRREQAEREKEKRANHYYSKVKSVPTKAARKVEEQTVVEELDMKEPPKNIFGKFLRWLRN
jgi:hypothetical protein